MKDKKEQHKIKVEKQVYWGSSSEQMIWADIKHLELEDDDVIHSGWVEDDNYDYHGYWHSVITRMVEETDDQFEKRTATMEQEDILRKEKRRELYLRLKEEFDAGK
jgi:hypothetical protein